MQIKGHKKKTSLFPTKEPKTTKRRSTLKKEKGGDNQKPLYKRKKGEAVKGRAPGYSAYPRKHIRQVEQPRQSDRKPNERKKKEEGANKASFGFIQRLIRQKTNARHIWKNNSADGLRCFQRPWKGRRELVSKSSRFKKGPKHMKKRGASVQPVSDDHDPQDAHQRITVQ